MVVHAGGFERIDHHCISGTRHRGKTGRRKRPDDARRGNNNNRQRIAAGGKCSDKRTQSHPFR